MSDTDRLRAFNDSFTAHDPELGREIGRIREIWRIVSRDPDHCPGGCYRFRVEPDRLETRALHVPVDMFWGRAPWKWTDHWERGW